MDNEKVIREGMEESKEDTFHPEELTPEQETPAAPAGDMPSAGVQTTGEGQAVTPAEEPASVGGQAAATSAEPPAQEEPPVSVKEKKSFLRSCGSWTDIIPIAAMLSVILTLFG